MCPAFFLFFHGTRRASLIVALGEVTITAKVAEAVTEVMCNAANLEIQKCTVSCGDGGSRVQDRASNDDSLKISQSRRRLK